MFSVAMECRRLYGVAVQSLALWGLWSKLLPTTSQQLQDVGPRLHPAGAWVIVLGKLLALNSLDIYSMCVGLTQGRQERGEGGRLIPSHVWPGAPESKDTMFHPLIRPRGPYGWGLKKSRLFYIPSQVPSQGSFHTWMVEFNNQGPEWSPASRSIAYY